MEYIYAEDKPTLEDLIEHHGVKGQKWGVRREQSGSSATEKTPRFSESQKSKAKKVAIGTGILLLAAGTAYAGYKLNQSGNLPLRSLSGGATKKGSSIAEKIAHEQTSVIHAARGKDQGFTFLRRGGLPDPLHQYEAAFGQDSGRTNFLKNLSDGKIAASFLDPEKRVDRAGRPIFHEVLIPKSMADGIKNVDDVQEKIWPTIKDQYDGFYDTKPTWK